MKECITYVLEYNKQCYSQYSACLLNSDCVAIYLNGRVQCEPIFRYDTDIYEPTCIK